MVGHSWFQWRCSANSPLLWWVGARTKWLMAVGASQALKWLLRPIWDSHPVAACWDSS